MSKAIAITKEYCNLPLTQLQESPTNPRRRFDERALEELAASFATQGILQPLLVRAVEDGRYEVVAGARRFRAAQLATLKEVPVRVVELSDAAVRESQLTENLLREDVHPYEEALALSGLLHLEGANYDVAAIASRLGKSPAYILQRIRLKELIPAIAEAFLADKIGVGHALEIAKLPHARQQTAFAGRRGCARYLCQTAPRGYDQGALCCYCGDYGQAKEGGSERQENRQCSIAQSSLNLAVHFERPAFAGRSK